MISTMPVSNNSGDSNDFTTLMPNVVVPVDIKIHAPIKISYQAKQKALFRKKIVFFRSEKGVVMSRTIQLETAPLVGERLSGLDFLRYFPPVPAVKTIDIDIATGEKLYTLQEVGFSLCRKDGNWKRAVKMLENVGWKYERRYLLKPNSFNHC